MEPSIGAVQLISRATMMHKMSLQKLVGLISHLKPNGLVAPLLEHLAFNQNQVTNIQAQQAMQDARIEALEKQLATLTENVMPQGLGKK